MKLTNETVQATWRTLNDFLDAVQDEIFEVRDTISNLRAELDAANEKIEELEERNAELTERLEELDEDATDKAAEFENAFYLAQQKINVLAEANNLLRKQLNGWKEK